MFKARERPEDVVKPHLSYLGGNSINDFKSRVYALCFKCFNDHLVRQFPKDNREKEMAECN